MSMIAAFNLADAMDPSADPCQDFYQYACGGWMKNNPIPQSKSSWSQFDILNQQLADTLKGMNHINRVAIKSYPVSSRSSRFILIDQHFSSFFQFSNIIIE